LQREDIEQWKRIKTQEGKSSQTINLTINALRGLYNYFLENNKIKENPLENVKTAKNSKREPKILTIDQVKIFFDKAKTANNTNKERNYLMMRVFLHCGLRISEIKDAKVSDFDFENGILRVVGKGDKERFVPLDDIVQEAFEIYMKFREKQNIDSEYIFVSRQNEQLSVDGIRNEVEYYRDLAGISKEITPHKLRHTFAMLMYESDVPLEIIQKMMGHSNMMTTQIYARASNNKMKKEAQKSPFRNI
jgi:site-specific recombinase XerD